MNVLWLVPGVVFFMVVLVGRWIIRCREKRLWNNGVCAVSGMPWVKRDANSQGGRLYRDMAGNHLWASYNMDRIKEKKE